MTASLLEYLKSGPPAPRVALLPDQRFFVRTVPIAAGTDASAVASQVELALEAISPFPAAQVFYGYHWVAGSPHALIFSSYRKRFTAEQIEEWGTAVLVIPAFAAFLEVEHKPATTLVYPTADGLTAIHWGDGPVPLKVLTANVPAEATPEVRTKIHDDLLRAAGENRAVIDLSAPPEIAVSSNQSAYLFRSGEFEARLAVDDSKSLDVRAPEGLAAFRSAQTRDLWFWRTTAASVAALVLLAIGQLALSLGGKMVQTAQSTKIKANAPRVIEIEGKEKLAESIEKLSTERLLPLEMLTLISGLPQRGQITFTRVNASIVTGRDTLSLTCTTPNAADVEAYRLALTNLPQVESADAKNTAQGRGGVTNTTLTIVFKPETLSAATKIAAAAVTQ